MISSRAQDALRQILFNAAKTRLAIDSLDRCDVRLFEQDEIGVGGECNAYVLTISSMQFRMLMILRVGLNEATQQYYLQDRIGRTFEEVFLEVTNLCCGAINQELIRYFPDLGMSTPYRLSNHCMRFIDSLRPSHLSSYSVVINDSARLSATICVCAHAPIDFSYDASLVSEESGELEMF